MLYKYTKSGLVSISLRKGAMRMLQAQLSGVQYADKSVPFHHPHNQPGTCLGVDIIPRLN